MPTKFDRPKLNIEITFSEKIVEVISAVFFIFIIISTYFGYSSLPQVIPQHFNFSGEPDSFGDKISILILPVITAMLYIVLSVVSGYPHLFNYPFNITEQNAYKQYLLARQFMRIMKLNIVTLFLLIQLMIIKSAETRSLNYGWLILVLAFLLVYPAIFIYYRKAKKINKEI